MTKEWKSSLTEYLAENGATIFTEARTACIKRICELHKCITFVHGNTWKDVESQLHSADFIK